MRNYILKTLSAEPKTRFSAKQVIKKIKVANHVDAVEMAMSDLASEGALIKVKEGKYTINPDYKAPPNRRNEVRRTDTQFTGIVDMTRSGSAYILAEGKDNDIFVSGKNLNGAMNGDKVLINSWTPRGRRKPEGKVLKVIERSSTHFLGTVRMFKNQALLMVDNAYNNIDIRIPFRDLNGADDGDKAIVKVVEWGKPGQDQFLVGKVETNLGKAESNDVEMNAILINNGFNIAFPSEVIEESEKLTDEITEADIAERRDFRKVTTITIDPDTAKDFDDALSYQKLDNGNIEIGIHIADVTHFVVPGTELDKEAFRRSTSVYLVDRVAPMLPEKISNELCSLRPNEDKFTFSAVFEFDDKFEIKREWFGKTFIHSDRRFTYEEAQEVIETGKGDFAEEVLMMNKVAHKLRKDKYKNGAISFESDEVKFELDEKGKPISVYVKERKDAHLLVEDFMLLANKGVAKYIDKKSGGVEIPFVYRVHDEPDPDRIRDFALFAKELGFDMKTDTPEQIVASFNSLAGATKENELLKMLEPLAIRTMAKAVYTTDNIGHYGLGFDFYAHFTSPIRRYADVLVHRILYANLGGVKRYNKSALEDQAIHISAQERKAMTAERESIKYKSVEFMQGKEGEEFDANISGMIDKGIFVQLKESKAEGLILFSDFKESFELSESKLKAVGLRTKRVLSMGQELRVKLIEADLHARQLDFEIVE
ncbi:ribonuclease R [Portibacter lacus]|uniref:ribonuclease R n=1 Tax=Portibacter lacus TaxID=1099794 RepID=UPI001F192F6D|nr:ribonuclease R [Portibacter lacus]